MIRNSRASLAATDYPAPLRAAVYLRVSTGRQVEGEVSIPSQRDLTTRGFAKSARGNVEDDELATARDIARVWLEADGKALRRALAEDTIQEVVNGKQEKD